MALTRSDYRQALQALTPPGAALPEAPGSHWQQLLDAIAGEFARVDARTDALVTESDARTASELLSDWERVTGLPDPCVTGEQTVEERRAAVVRVLTATGGQSPAYFAALAAELGYAVTIEEYHPHSVGDDVAYPLYGRAWRWAWTVRSAEDTVSWHTVIGTVRAPLATWGNEQLECVIERFKPAQTHVLFAYGDA